MILKFIERVQGPRITKITEKEQRCQAHEKMLLAIWQMKIKATQTYNITHILEQLIGNTDYAKQAYKETKTLRQCWWEYKMVQSF